MSLCVKCGENRVRNDNAVIDFVQLSLLSSCCCADTEKISQEIQVLVLLYVPVYFIF